MGNDSDTETKEKEKINNNYITFESVQESLNLSNPKLFKKYLHEVFLDLSSVSDSKNIKYVSKICFYDYIKLPIFISDKLFKSFKNHSKGGLLETEFVNGFHQLYMGTFEETTKIIFNLLDFDKDSKIEKEDVKLILAYLLLSDFNNNSLDDNSNDIIIYDKQMKKLKEINDLINKTFKKGNMNLDEFIECLKKKKSDIYLQILCFLYSKKPFSKKSIICLKSKYMNDEEYQKMSKNYISLRKSSKNIIMSPTKNNNEIINKVINKKNLSPKTSEKKLKEINVPFKKSESTPMKGHHRYVSCGEISSEMLNKYTNKENKKGNIVFSPSFTSFSYEEIEKNNINYENYIYKISENNKISNFYLLLINNDIYYYKTKEKKELIGMHNLSSCFIEEYENKGEKVIDNLSYYSFSLIFKSNSKLRKFYTTDIEIYEQFILNIKQAIGYRKFEDYYEIKEEIGVGRNSHVNLGIQKNTGKLVTIKIIEKKDETKKEEELVRYEIDILKFCHHKNIVHLIDYFETFDSIIIILNYVEGCTLGEYLKENNFNFKESKAANIILQIANGIKYLHKFGIIHRDLKPDNIMITQIDSEIKVKIMDFGLSKIVSKEEKLIEGFGTLYYAAPEIIQNMPYNKEIDVWSLGVILFYMFTGYYPFVGKEEDEIEEKIINEPVEFKDGEWEKISENVQDLIRKCLEKYPEDRISIDDFINHPWFNN